MAVSGDAVPDCCRPNPPAVAPSSDPVLARNESAMGFWRYFAQAIMIGILRQTHELQRARCWSLIPHGCRPLPAATSCVSRVAQLRAKKERFAELWDPRAACQVSRRLSTI